MGGQRDDGRERGNARRLLRGGISCDDMAAGCCSMYCVCMCVCARMYVCVRAYACVCAHIYRLWQNSAVVCEVQGCL